MFMRKFTIVFVGLCLLLQIFAPGLIFPVKIARAGTLSTGMFPSSLAGLPLYQTSTQIDSPCYYDAEEFVVGVYIQQAAVTTQLGISLSKWPGSSKAESVARDCIDQVKQQFGTTVTWTQVKDTTVSGYKSISTTATVPAEGLYMAVLYTVAQDYLIASALASTASVSVSTLKDVNATMVTKLPAQEPPEPEPEPEKKDDGQTRQAHEAEERASEEAYRREKADQITKEKIEVPEEYKIGGFWGKLKNFATFKVFLFIALAFGIILILAGVYISFKRKS